MREKHGLDVDPVDSAEEAARDVDILVTITGANEPVMSGEWLGPGYARQRHRRDGHQPPRARRRGRPPFRPHRRRAPGAVQERQRELLYAEAEGAFDWSNVIELADIVVGKASGRPSAEAITQFNALGVGTEDLAAASVVYRKAIEQGRGIELAM